MSGIEHRFWARWRHAAKPNSWPKLLVPASLGQALGVAEVGRLGIGALVGGLAFTLAHLLFVVFLNDWGDRSIDALKRRLFPESCSPKTIPDRIMRPGSLLCAGLGCGVVAVAVAFSCELALDRPHLGWAGLGCLALLLAYTFPPLKLNYRGGGEWLEMIGVGAALPLFQSYLQAGSVGVVTLLGIVPLVPLALASALASGLSDEVSDRLGGKRTYATQAGNAAVRRRVSWLVLTSIGALCVLPWTVSFFAIWVVIPAVALMIHQFRGIERLRPAAVSSAYPAQALYKQALHRCIWWGMGAFATCIFLARGWTSP